MVTTYVRAGGLVFLLFGALWAAVGLWLPDILLVAVGGVIAVAGTVLLALASRMARRDSPRVADDERA